MRGALVGALLIALLCLLAALPHRDALAPDIDHGLTAMGAPLSPSGDALLGTDDLGRDVFARISAGTATSLELATLSTLLALAIGLVVGLCAGYAGGAIDNVLMRLVDLVLAFPFLLLAILLAALLREADLASANAPVVLTLGIVGWTTTARVIRGKTLTLARSEYVVAARAVGCSPLRIIVRHILPNVAGLVAVLAALAFAQNLLAESVLSYLGLGLPPPAPTWGRMLFEARAYYRSAPWLTIAPGLAILTAVVAFNLLAEGLRARFDPKERR
ncbi:MAG: ABC transporter permease [Deltaproteobacteria bacterium]|nr:ABC transporter permease [Deltaproteobacteria bacterium]